MKTFFSKFFFVIGTLILIAASFMVLQARTANMDSARSAIDQMHKQDIEATLSSDQGKLAALWSDDGVLISPGAPPIVGKAAIQNFLAQSLAKNPTMKVLKYEPEITDLQISGEVAYEWGYFNASQQASPSSEPFRLRARFLRVLRRQADGSWKFVRVMWSPEGQ